ncbi:RNase H domain-containing protein [Trichonephila clavipes]|nr:RNase H domain-containing protein [Trichonephila clavipes]
MGSLARITILQSTLLFFIILLLEKISASSISNYDCILSPFFIPHPSERNAINTVQFSDKSTEDFPVICYTDGSKIDGRVGFAFVVFRSGVESENFQFRIRDECTVFVAELLCLNFAVKWITEQNSVISEYLICTDTLSSLDSLKCISSSNNILVEIQKQLKSLRDKNISIDFAFVRGHTGVLGNERADWLAKAATKRKIDIDVNIPKSFYKKITNEGMMKSWNQEYLISNKGSITKNFFPTINKRLSCHHFYTNYKLTQFLTGHAMQRLHFNYKKGVLKIYKINFHQKGVKQDVSFSWKQTPVHQWYEENHPGAASLGTRRRRYETAGAQRHVVGLKVYPSPNCNVT